MKPNDIAKIENELDIELPSTYKKLVLNHPFENEKKFRIACNVILNDATKIIDLNNTIRNRGFQNKGWDKSYFIIGHLSMKHFYFINLNDMEKEYIYFLETSDKFNAKNISKLIAADSFEDLVGNQIDFQNILNNP
ncbi:MAG: SMI1/KNR4 family protein [Desulfobulbaceae bacterium]|nr:SMI1/KNR4 family protein [Desulfobulbaceae bacterium]